MDPAVVENLIFHRVLGWPFRRINWDIRLMLSAMHRNLLSCSNCEPRECPETWCHQNDVFIYFVHLRVDDHLKVSTRVGGACDFTSAQVNVDTHFYGVFVSLAHRTDFFSSFRSKFASFYLPLVLPPDGFVYVYAHNPSSVSSMGWTDLQVNDGLRCSWLSLI